MRAAFSGFFAAVEPRSALDSADAPV